MYEGLPRPLALDCTDFVTWNLPLASHLTELTTANVCDFPVTFRVMLFSLPHMFHLYLGSFLFFKMPSSPTWRSNCFPQSSSLSCVSVWLILAFPLSLHSNSLYQNTKQLTLKSNISTASYDPCLSCFFSSPTLNCVTFYIFDCLLLIFTVSPGAYVSTWTLLLLFLEQCLAIWGHSVIIC